MDTAEEFAPLVLMVLVVCVSPLLARASRGWVPDTVWLLLGGLLIGPSVLGLAAPSESLGLLSEIGLGLLFLLAGFEIDPQAMRSRQGRLAWLVWAVSFALAVVFTAVFAGEIGFFGWAAVGIALTSTALGTLLPILSNAGVLRTPVGAGTMVHGAVGELGPVLAMALLLTGRDFSLNALVLVAFVIIMVLTVVLPLHLGSRIPALRRALIDGASGTSQLVLRVIMLVLITLMFLSAVLDLDVVLGAFIAGMLVRRIAPAEATDRLETGLQTLGFSFFIPVFFVYSGMGIAVAAVAEAPLMLLGFFAAIVLLRGLPLVLGERFLHITPGVTGLRQQTQIGLYGATGLPIIVAVTSLAESSELITAEVGSLLVLAGACTVLILPALAALLQATAPTTGTDSAEAGPAVDEPR
ncbi:cation:proton antiporter [Brevibacterium casei]